MNGLKQTFYEVQLPRITEALLELKSEMKRANALKEKELELKEREFASKVNA